MAELELEFEKVFCTGH